MESFEIILVVLVLIFVSIFLYQTIFIEKSLQKQEQQVQSVDVIGTPDVVSDRVLPYWVYYGNPGYVPVYTTPYWFYDVPYYGPITGRDSYRPWGPRGRGGYRPGHGSGYRGVATGGGGGGGHGGGGGGGGGGGSHGGR